MTSGKKWLVGCGMGCGAVILLALALVAVGYSYVRDFVSDIEGSEQSQACLDARLDGIEAYTPARSNWVRCGN